VAGRPKLAGFGRGNAISRFGMLAHPGPCQLGEFNSCVIFGRYWTPFFPLDFSGFHPVSTINRVRSNSIIATDFVAYISADQYNQQVKEQMKFMHIILHIVFSIAHRHR